MGKKSDDFHFISSLAFVFEVWDFLSDCLLCFTIYDHWYQASSNNPDKIPLFWCFIASVIFTFVPWGVNLWFLLKIKENWELTSTDKTDSMLMNQSGSRNFGRYNDALYQSSVKTSKWLNEKSKFLVFFCMISGCVAESVEFVNSNLFGLSMFNMGLPKYRQDETARHKLWLAILLENVPQIIISIVYASQLGQFKGAVTMSLISSFASIILAFISIVLEFPKNYYIYQIDIKLRVSKNPNLRENLRMKKRMAKIICGSMNKEDGSFFVENIYFNGVNIVCFNLVSNEIIDDNSNSDSNNGDDDHDRKLSLTLNDHSSRDYNYARQKNIANAFKNDSKLKIICDSVTFRYVTHKCIALDNGLRCNCFDKMRADEKRLGNEIEMNMLENNEIKSNYDPPMVDEFGISATKSNSNVSQLKWYLWTRKQVTSWVDQQLQQSFEQKKLARIRASDKDNTNDNDDDGDELMRISNLVDKFDQLDIDGYGLYQCKTNSAEMDTLKECIISQFKSFGFWLTFSKAIESLEMPNDNPFTMGSNIDNTDNKA